MRIQLKSHLDRLEAIERSRPAGQRRRVPTLRDLAPVAGWHEVTMYRFAAGRMRCIPVERVERILDYLNRNGWPTRLCDILEYVPPPELPSGPR